MTKTACAVSAGTIRPSPSTGTVLRPRVFLPMMNRALNQAKRTCFPESISIILRPDGKTIPGQHAKRLYSQKFFIRVQNGIVNIDKNNFFKLRIFQNIFLNGIYRNSCRLFYRKAIRAARDSRKSD